MGWVTLVESVAGTSHHRTNTPCQDASQCRQFGGTDGWLAAIVADGAGSASRAEVGAALTCAVFADRIEATPDAFCNREGMIGLFTDVHQALVEEADRLGVSPRELACTALVAVIGPATAVFAQLGDGVMVVSDGSACRTVFWPEPAEYANATDFLTDEHFADALQFVVIDEPIPEVALLTDGLQRLALNFTTCEAHAPFFRPLFDRLRTAADPAELAAPFRAFLDSPRVNERTDDDKTLFLAVRRP